MNIIFTGAKGTSKSTTEKMLTGKAIGFYKVTSYTTRNPRNGEVDHEDYHFISEQGFHMKEIEGDFCEVTKYNENYYAIASEDILNGKDNVIVVEIEGLKQILDSIPREEAFVVKMDCIINEQLLRIFQRDDVNSYDDAIELIKTLKADREYFTKDYEYDYYIDTTNMCIEDVVSDVLLAYGKYLTFRREV
jgi:guanylate kinase